jgi:hypothetical protein
MAATRGPVGRGQNYKERGWIKLVISCAASIGRPTTMNGEKLISAADQLCLLPYA